MKKKKKEFFFFFGFFPVLLRSCYFEMEVVSLRKRGFFPFFVLLFCFVLPSSVIKSLLDCGWKLWDSLDSSGVGLELLEKGV